MRQLLAALLLTSAPCLAQTPAPSVPKPETVLAQEQLFWTSYVSGDTKTLNALLAPDFTSVEQDIWDRGKVIDFVRMFFSRCSLAPMKMVDRHVTFLTPEIATVVYHAPSTQRGESHLWRPHHARRHQHQHRLGAAAGPLANAPSTLSTQSRPSHNAQASSFAGHPIHDAVSWGMSGFRSAEARV